MQLCNLYGFNTIRSSKTPSSEKSMNQRPSLRTVPLLVLSLGLWASVVQAGGANTAQKNKEGASYFGAGAWGGPAYLGGDGQLVTLIPLVRYHGDAAFARTTHGLLEAGVRQNLGVGLTAGLQLAYEAGREINASDFMKSKQVANLGASASWGTHLDWDGNLGPAPANVMVRYRQDAKSDRGAQVDLRGMVGVYGGVDLKAGIFTQFTWADAKSAQTYYGNVAAENLLPAFDAGSGLIYSSVGVQWSYELAPRWAMLGSLEKRELASRLQNSPFVQASANTFLSIGVVRQF